MVNFFFQGQKRKSFFFSILPIFDHFFVSFSKYFCYNIIYHLLKT